MLKLIPLLFLASCVTTDPECPMCEICQQPPDCYEQVIQAKTKCTSELVDYKVKLLKCLEGRK